MTESRQIQLRSVEAPPFILSDAELADLGHAKQLLENPGFAIRLAGIIGAPIEKGFELLPTGWNNVVQRASHAALEKSFDVVVSTMGKRPRAKSSDRMHKALVAASGGIAGTIGLVALPVELPISAGIMMRSIADIARSEGHELDSWDTRLACLEVFALGKPGRSNPSETAYWAVRTALSQSIADVGKALVGRGAAEKSAPVVARLITAISSRFGVVVSEEIAAKAVPIIGAAGGTIANLTFIKHYQETARGHFIVKRLEKKYGMERIREEYERAVARPKKVVKGGKKT